MNKPTVAVVIPSYKGAERVRFLMNTVMRNDAPALDRAWFVVEDPSDEAHHREYLRMLEDFPKGLIFNRLDAWSNMHGAARKAFEKAMSCCDPTWIIYLGDDLAVTPGALSNMIYFLTENELDTIGLVQFAYWNAHDLCATHDSEWEGPKLFWTKERDFYASADWTDKVPLNPHWQGESPHHARPYVNVNGVGFACRAETYRLVEGFAEGTWCLDESISVRTWLRSSKSIVCLPGPPLVHYFGASTMCDPPKHDMHTEERWIEAMGMSKAAAGQLSYEKMALREENVKSEMAAARYWQPPGERKG